MTVVERQLHGYRQGHQLLAGSVRLPKEDQSALDRLSDVAGPLRPREQFEPYLTAYPLPSGERYVLARTWQDLTVARAGCVRTLSLIIPMADWATATSLVPYLDMLRLDHLPDVGDVEGAEVRSGQAGGLPPAPDFKGGELLEALFLEDPQPVVVFDAQRPELVMARLLTALWPSLRRSFAACTFALSPRRVGGRDFDLVFAPKDARAKFADWSGRRVDGRSAATARHRWTGSIVGRVFNDPQPRLLSNDEVGLVGGDGDGADNAAALRIAMLWDELLAKLETTPTAALGLLDIANSGKVRNAFALHALEPSLVQAIRRAPAALPERDAWDFLGAILRKMHGRSMERGAAAVSEAVGELIDRAPDGAIALLSQSDERGATAALVPVIAAGIATAPYDLGTHALLMAPPGILGRMIIESDRLAARVAKDHLVVARFGEVAAELEDRIFDAVGAALLPLLVLDWQLPAAEPFISRLDGPHLAAEIRHLGMVNDFEGTLLARRCIQRARSIGSKQEILAALGGLPSTSSRNDLIPLAVDPVVEDARWLLRYAGLDEAAAAPILLGLLKQADDRQLAAMITDDRIGDNVLALAEREAPELLRRILLVDGTPLELFLQVVGRVVERSSGDERVQIARRALQRCLGVVFGGNELAFLASMLGVVGDRLDVAWAARVGLSHSVAAGIASRNMVAFRRCPDSAKRRIVAGFDEVARVLRDRRSFDLDEAASEACAHFIFDAEKSAYGAALGAAGLLLPMLMRQTSAPVSLVVAAAFPLIYRELAKKDDVPDLLKFIPFFDWDRCKAARHELVSAFMSSKWAPADLAMTACRCNDVARILRRTAKSYGGETYLGRVEADLARVTDGCRGPVQRAISSIRNDPASKLDWRD